MSRIVHVCQSCNHPQDQHPGQQGCSLGWCGCRSTTFGPSELRPTWSNATAQEVTTVHPPGSPFDGGKPKVILCSCDECVELFRAVAG